ncbi:hypothetical protein [Niabella beijingensis]|uniref:hypothetical protein n=1 Tax=Niabella beijingensis TaxID=2872700 RepID=UPI001CBE8E27|nr:hypothetical protein [Niabella beijingensis]MBZ4192158.1 hypothetical protein [Niabella beijingensis]
MAMKKMKDSSVPDMEIVHSPELQTILDKVVADAKIANPNFPYPGSFEFVDPEDAGIDQFLMLEDVNFKSKGLGSYYHELKEANLFSLLDKIGGTKHFFEVLHTLCEAVKQNTARPIFVRNTILELLQNLDSNPGPGTVLQLSLLIGIEKWMLGIDLNEGDTGYDEMQRLFNWIFKRQLDVMVAYDISIIKNDNSKVFDEYLLTTRVGAIYGDYKDGKFDEQDEDELNAGADVADVDTVADQCDNITHDFPSFRLESIPEILEMLKDFFNEEDQARLETLIRTGKIEGEKLLFQSAGKRLSDFFKQLIIHDFITGCQKKTLVQWIAANFRYLKRGVIQDYKIGTVLKTISRNDYDSMNPIMEIVKGKIERAEAPNKRIKKSTIRRPLRGH